MSQANIKGKSIHLHYTPHGKINNIALLKRLILFIHQGVIMTVNFVTNILSVKQRFVLEQNSTYDFSDVILLMRFDNEMLYFTIVFYWWNSNQINQTSLKDQ